MPGVAVIGSGNYDLEIDTGYDWNAFVLDDALKGELDNTQLSLMGLPNSHPLWMELSRSQPDADERTLATSSLTGL
jgi:hypothetical protein